MCVRHVSYRLYVLGLGLAIVILTLSFYSGSAWSIYPPPVDDVILSFLDRLCDADWYGGGLQTKEFKLPCPGSDTDDRGFVRPLGQNFTLENNQPAVYSFQTHPMWVTDGYIYGVFKLGTLGISLQSGDRFVAEVGFLMGASTGEVRFSVWYDSSPEQSGGETKLAEKDDHHDGNLKDIDVDLSPFVGGGGAIILRVDAKGSSGQDWAVWVDPRIERQVVPSPTTPPPTYTPSPSLIPTSTPTPTCTPSPSVTPTALDLTPPKILSGPDVSQVTQTSAQICWQTDEPSDSRVVYDHRAAEFGFEFDDPQLVNDHCLGITGLSSTATYHFFVTSKDAVGNTASSSEVFFTTLSEADDEKPMVALELPKKLSGITPISIAAVDNVGVDRVILILDGVHLFTDYSLPFQRQLDTRQLDDGDHTLSIQVFDAAGNMADVIQQISVQNRFPEDQSPVIVSITDPANNSNVIGWMGIHAEVTHRNDANIRRVEFKLDPETDDEQMLCEKDYRYLGTLPVPQAGGYIDIHTGRPPVYETCSYDFGLLEPESNHIIDVRAWDELGNLGRASVSVTVLVREHPQVGAIPIPHLEITREVTRRDNYFEVELTLHNVGDVDVRNIILADTNLGFQSIGYVHASIVADGPFGPAQPVRVVDTHEGRSSQLQFQYGATIPSRGVLRLVYFVVPILFSREAELHYSIGDPILISYQAEDENYSEGITETRWSSSADVDEAFQASDYIIATSTQALFAHYDVDEVNTLLSTMAELAKEKNGVLGNLPETILPIAFKAHLGGAPLGPGSVSWDGRLGNLDYVLIVGETEIVPTWTNLPLPCNMTGHDGFLIFSDYPYTDIQGDERPELKVGRIIGTTAEELTLPIRSSLEVNRGEAGLDGSVQALMVSGYDGTWESHVKSIESGVSELREDGMDVIPVHTEYFTMRCSQLSEALAIAGYSTTADLCGAHTANELAAWLLWEEGRLPGFEKDEAIADADSIISEELLDQALTIAERIQRDRPSRNGDYGWSYRPYADTFEEAANRKLTALKNNTADKEFIMFYGHGATNGWSHVLDHFVGRHTEYPFEPIDFGESRPLVIAVSCHTGNFQADPVESIARAFLKNHAAVYFGATEPSPSNKNTELVSEIFWRHWTPTIPIGDVLFDLKTWMIETNDNCWRFEAYEYNLYGDPKFQVR